MQHHDIEKHDHHRLMNLLMFGGAAAGLSWTLYIVWVALVGLAAELRKF